MRRLFRLGRTAGSILPVSFGGDSTLSETQEGRLYGSLPSRPSSLRPASESSLGGFHSFTLYSVAFLLIRLATQTTMPASAVATLMDGGVDSSNRTTATIGASIPRVTARNK